tara:strand:+ start:1791 stop:2042 length:252 start_codon:yes stop_codon:yes gene_type:complete
MNLQADIKWIQEELTNVKDPNLIEAFKNMLKYRKTKNKSLSATQEELKQRAEESLQAIKKGETVSLSAFQTENKEWLNNRVSR